MDDKSRPLSPHLFIYQPQITWILSFFHRVTGCALAVGTVFVAWWLFSIVNGIDSYATFHWVAKSWLGQLALLGYMWAICYHMLNGIRHLAWDLGFGFDMNVANKSGLAVLGGSGALTVFFWVIAWLM
jgi:succinate dehydrogenase / fumarate reductase cytochrome b subunit